MIDIDLHGYHPDNICGEPLALILQRAWQAGADSVRLIHGHGRNRGLSQYRVNTNTGYFGLRVRSQLRYDDDLRQWIKRTTLDCSHEGSTVIKLKPNPAPTLDPAEVQRNWFGRAEPRSSEPLGFLP